VYANTWNCRSSLIGLSRPSLEFHSLNLVIRMVETGDWTTYDLVNYLVSIQPILTPQEFERLRRASAFPKENAGREQLAAGASRKVQRYEVKDLYEPNDLFRELGLPIFFGAIINGIRNPIMVSSCGGLRLKIRMTYQLHSQVHLYIGFEASTSLARNSPYRVVGQSHSTDKGSRILLGQFIRHLLRLSPSKFLGPRVRPCSTWVGENAGDTI
jgi:hypothetical protein